MIPAPPAEAGATLAQALVRPRLIPIHDVASLLGLSVPTIERQLQAGRLPMHRRIGRRNLWDVEELSEWLSRPKPDGRLMTASEWRPVWNQLVKAGRN